VKGLLDRNVSQLSGGELQRVAIAVCLSREAQLYLLDEPSAYLDVEERLNMARTIRRTIENKNATAFVKGVANPPTTLRKGMNAFLKKMEVTFRRDPTTKRPRVNKEGSRTDKYQREIGEYYYVAEKQE